MYVLYNFIFLLFAILYLPIYIFRRKFHPGFSMRLGFLPKDLKLNRPIWIHAVSVGEAMAIRTLVRQLRDIYPVKQFVISTVTPTGNKIAKSIAKDSDFVTYLPLDFSFILRRIINKINPCVFIIAETEIWPNLISVLYRNNIPIITVNGRISDSSFKGYLAVKFLINNILKKVTLFCVQSECDANRFKALGVSEEKIKITGNMKFDAASYLDIKFADCTQLKKKLGLKAEDKVFIAASTHPKEEEIILNAYKKLWDEFPNLYLIIAPRHPERSKEILNIISSFRFCGRLISSLPSSSVACATKPVFILDVIGQLINFYAISDIVFVGGSLVKKGGHNILEPAALTKPIIFGPHMFNFSDITDLFLSHKTAIMVHNQEELKSCLERLLNDPSQAARLGKQASQLIQYNLGASAKNAESLRKFIV